MDDRMQKIQDGIKKIRELTYVDYPEIVGETRNEQFFNLSKGSGKSTGLLKNTEIAVAVSNINPDSIFDGHTHTEKEILIVYHGEMQLSILDPGGSVVSKILRVGDVVEIEPNTFHRAEVNSEGVQYVAITIPADKSFPTGLL